MDISNLVCFTKKSPNPGSKNRVRKSSVKKYIRRFLKTCEELGMNWEFSGSGHIKIKTNTGMLAASLSSTPGSEERWINDARASIRKTTGIDIAQHQ